jgi:hypothetical protein
MEKGAKMSTTELERKISKKCLWCCQFQDPKTGEWKSDRYYYAFMKLMDALEKEIKNPKRTCKNDRDNRRKNRGSHQRNAGPDS